VPDYSGPGAVAGRWSLVAGRCAAAVGFRCCSSPYVAAVVLQYYWFARRPPFGAGKRVQHPAKQAPELPCTKKKALSGQHGRMFVIIIPWSPEIIEPIVAFGQSSRLLSP